MSADPLAFAEALIACGIPVVVCRPNLDWKPGDHHDVFPPTGWGTVTAEACDLSAFRPGVDTLAMVAGHGIDVVDVDSKAGASPDDLPAFEHFGVHRTPSGGWHYFVPSTGYGKRSPLVVDGKVVGDYCGGTAFGGSRLLTYLPGSTRPKYPGAAYTVEHPVNIPAILSATPDPDLLAMLAAAGAPTEGSAGSQAVQRAEALAFLAEHVEPSRCRYGRAAVAAMLADADSAKGTLAGRHGWAVRTCSRLVELIRAGCASREDYDDMAAALERIKPEGGTDPLAVLRWALANADGTSECVEHGPNGVAAWLGDTAPAATATADTEPDAEVDVAAVPPDHFELEVRAEARRLRVQQAARDRVRAETLPPAPPFDAGLLADLEGAEQPTRWRVENVLAVDANASVIAMRKTGKTTFMLNLARSLKTGEPFLGQFAVDPVDGVVAMLNFEVSAHQAARWAVEVGVPGDGLLLVSLRGRRNPFGDPEQLARLAALLRQHGTDVLMVDPFGRAYTGKSQNDPGEVGSWLVGLDQFAADVGASSTILAVHAGWEGERSRGGSALEDWPDSLCYLTRDKDSGARFLRLDGRDVTMDEDRLDFDPVTRRLSLTGDGGRAAARDSARRATVAAALLDLVRAEPGLSVVELTERLRAAGVGLQRGDVSAAATLNESRGLIERRKNGRSMLHYSTSPDQSRRVPSGLMNESRPVPLGRDSLQDSSGGIDFGTSQTSADAVGLAVSMFDAEAVAS